MILAPVRFDRNRSQRVDLLRVGSSWPTVHPGHGWTNLSRTTIKIDGSTVEVEVAPGDLDLPVAKFISWVSGAARAVTDYYSPFPVPQARLLTFPVTDRDHSLT